MKVSVWITAYNHEKYISQCLDSVLMQKTNFDFEIILGEDCSTDSTREIAIDYQKKHPDKIKLFLPEKNMGAMEIDLPTWKMCSGEYLALLTGDDYWLDENKLQIQTDFLNNNPDTVLCFHKALIENETTGKSEETVYLESTDSLPAESLLNGYNPIQTASVMYKNIIDIPDWYPELPYGDMFLYLLLSQKGKIKYIDRLMSVYRIHSNGQWQGETVYNNILKDLQFYKVMNEKLDFKYDGQIKKIFAQRYFDLIISDIRNHRFESAKNYLKELRAADPEFRNQNENEIHGLEMILFEKEDLYKYEEIINREPKWKVN